MTTWQLAVVLAVQAAASYLSVWLTEQRVARREARRAVLDQKLHEALRDLFEQRDRQRP
jgi:low affinity Fe/Cu permease